VITGLQFKDPSKQQKVAPPLPPRAPAALAKALQRKGASPGVRFTFAIYENQRRWVMLGYTNNLLPNERQAWTDEHLNTVPEKEQFPLPDTDFDTTKWRWVPESEWRVDPGWGEDVGSKGSRDKEGWTYYDNKWQGPGKTDDWGKWTRRRRWIRDAELVELSPEEAAAAATNANANEHADAQSVQFSDFADADGVTFAVKKKGWFGKRRLTNEKIRAMDKADVVSVTGSCGTGETKTSMRSREDALEEFESLYRYREQQWDRSIGDGLAEGLS
jgi:hypothetical protein